MQVCAECGGNEQGRPNDIQRLYLLKYPATAKAEKYAHAQAHDDASPEIRAGYRRKNSITWCECYIAGLPHADKAKNGTHARSAPSPRSKGTEQNRNMQGRDGHAIRMDKAKGRKGEYQFKRRKKEKIEELFIDGDR